MSLRQRALRQFPEDSGTLSLPCNNSNSNSNGNGNSLSYSTSTSTSNGKNGITKNPDLKRIKGRNINYSSNLRPWMVDLSLLVAFVIMLACSYLVMGGSGHGLGTRDGELSPPIASSLTEQKVAPPRKLRQVHLHKKQKRDTQQKQHEQQQLPTLTQQGNKETHVNPGSDHTGLQHHDHNNQLIKQKLMQYDKMEQSEQVRNEKQQLLKQIRLLQQVNLKKLPTPLNHEPAQSNITLDNLSSTQSQSDKKFHIITNQRHLEQQQQQQHSSILFEAHDKDWGGSCHVQAKDRMHNVHTLEEAIQWMEDFSSCAEQELATQLVDLNKEISLQARTRLDIAGRLENYTCVDPNAPMSPDVSSHTWLHPRDDFHRTVHVKHNRSASKIHVIENFISSEECDAMEKAASTTLHVATVADGKGGSKVSDHRKAMQAGIHVPWHKEKDGNPIARLSRRVYDYTNFALGLNINEHGQEDLMSIQYFGRGKDDEHPDRYMPHCDGDCTGLAHHDGTRMATMVVYCTVPELGGSTNFRNAGVHVKPTVGNAVFFSYMDPLSKLTDNRFTEHSGCPVYEGQKKIVTQWIRMGVDDKNPWDSFNTLGIRIKDAQQYD